MGVDPLIPDIVPRAGAVWQPGRGCESLRTSMTWGALMPGWWRDEEVSERCFGLGVCADELGLDDGGLRGRRVLRAAKLSIISALP